MSVIGIKEDKAQQAIGAAKLAMRAKGGAVAHLFVAHIREAAGSLKRFLQDIAALDQEGRKAFRVSINEELKAMRKGLKAVQGKPEHAAHAAAGRSYGVRISEAVTFSRACDAGVTFNFERNYHALIGDARTLLASESANGPTVKRGRKATPTLDKVKKYLASLALSSAELHEVETLVHTMAQVQESQQAAPL